MDPVISFLKQIPYAKEIYFVLLLLLIFIARVALIRLCAKYIKDKDRNRHRDNEWFSFIKSLINWLTFYSILIFVLAYFPEKNLLNHEIFQLASKSITPINIITSIIIMTLGFRLSQFFTRFLLRPSFRKYELDVGLQYTFQRISHYIIVTLAVLISFMTLGLNLSALTVFAGVLGVGVGFGMQNIASNFISGIILLFERPFKVGDTVKVDDLLCEVEDIQMRATVVRSLDNERIIIPNSHFVENQIVNWSYGDDRIRIAVPIGVAYGSDVERVKRLLLQAAEEEEHVLANPRARVEFLEFGDSSLNFRLLVWAPSPSLKFITVSNINFKINALFLKYNIEIPFPQRDLHVRSVDAGILRNIMDEYKKSGL